MNNILRNPRARQIDSFLNIGESSLLTISLEKCRQLRVRADRTLGQASPPIASSRKRCLLKILFNLHVITQARKLNRWSYSYFYLWFVDDEETKARKVKETMYVFTFFFRLGFCPSVFFLWFYVWCLLTCKSASGTWHDVRIVVILSRPLSDNFGGSRTLAIVKVVHDMTCE